MRRHASLADRPHRLRIHRFLDSGSTGIVYGATLDGDESRLADATNDVPTFAVKVMLKSSTGEGQDRLFKLENEYSIYARIHSEDKEKKSVLRDMTPRCYGIYETDSTIFILLEYVGERVRNWNEVTIEGR